MSDWAAANLQLRADRDAMDEVKRREAQDEPLFIESCGNVFADLGLPNADELLAQADARIAAGVPPRLVMRPVDLDCGCTPGVVCTRNAACPRA